MLEQFSKASSVSLLVVGDLILDEYIEGQIHRMSAEAPIPVVDQTDTKHVLGGSANVAANITSLGGNAHLIGVIGDDLSGQILVDLLQDIELTTDSLIIDKSRPTTTKTRVTVSGQQKLRIDREETTNVEENIEKRVLQKVEALILEVDGIVLQDYNKGMLTPTLIADIMSLASTHNKPTFVDPKSKNFWAYKGATIFKPNKKEITEAQQSTDLTMEEMLKITLRQLSCQAIICTLAEDGVAIMHEKNFHREPADQIEVVDVSGAGDSTIAMISIAYLLGYSLDQLPILCNLAGKASCMQQGVGTITLEQVRDSLTSIH